MPQLELSQDMSQSVSCIHETMKQVMNLPDGSGLELLDAARKQHPTAVLVALSSKRADKNRARRCDIDGFLAKPFALNDLFAIVQRFIVEDIT